MKFEYRQILIGSTTLYLLKYKPFSPEKFDHYLSPSEKSRFDSFRNTNRKREFLATRILFYRIFGEERIQYNENGAPFTNTSEFISISHSKNIVGIAVNPHFFIGLDLEPHRKNILELTKKFLSNTEKVDFDTSCPIEMTKVWSAKEALYKLAGRKKIFFATELLLNKDEEGNWQGTIVNSDHRLSVKLDIFELNGTIVSINKEAIVKLPHHT